MIEIETGSANVYADLGRADADRCWSRRISPPRSATSSSAAS